MNEKSQQLHSQEQEMRLPMEELHVAQKQQEIDQRTDLAAIQ